MNTEALYPNIQDNEPSPEAKCMQDVVIRALREVYRQHKKLGEEGKKYLEEKNWVGQKTLVADWEAEEAIINSLLELDEPIFVVSEEHGKFNLSYGDSKYLAVMDGIDGSFAYRFGRGPYATSFAIFKGGNPKYEDYLASGILEHPSGRIFVASKNGGSFIIEDGRKIAIGTSEEPLKFKNSRIYVDGYFDVNNAHFSRNLGKFKELYVGTQYKWAGSDITYTRLAQGHDEEGNPVSAVCECTRKGNLEIAAAVGLIEEAGGVVLTLDGESLAQRRYLSFGQGRRDRIPYIAAANEEVGRQLIDYLFREQKRRYFFDLGAKQRRGLRLHKEPGRHFKRNKEGKKDWRDVPEHALVVSARTQLLAELLGLSDEVKRDLGLALSVHDFSKRHEKELEVPEGGITWDMYEENVALYERKILTNREFSKRAIRISEHTGHDGVLKVERILAKDELTGEEIVSIIIFYVDAYTRSSDWVIPAEQAEDGSLINEIDRRTERNLKNPTLENLNKEGKLHFNGMTMSEAIGLAAHSAAERIVELLEERVGIKVTPKRLPEFVDEEIKREIWEE